MFVTAPVLARWDPDSKIIVKTDMLDRAIAAIISTYSRGDIHPIAFHSRTFNDTEFTSIYMIKNYWQFLRLLKDGIITWREQSYQ